MSKDPHKIHERLEIQIHLVLEELETNPDLYVIKDRLQVVQICGMYLTRNIKLSADEDTQHVGSKVRAYAGAFKTRPPTNVTRKRAASGGSAAPAFTVVADDDADPDAG